MNLTLSTDHVDTGRKLDVHKTFKLRPVSTGVSCQHISYLFCKDGGQVLKY